MTKTDLWSRISRKGANPEKFADQAIQRRELLPHLMEGLDAEDADVRFGCSKILRLVSQKAPETLYPHIDFFVGQLKAENNFLKWDAIRIVGNLATADSRGRIEQILDEFLEPIRGPVMITANNTIQSAATIAQAKPALANSIARAILKVQWAQYQTDECQNVAIGQAIDALDSILTLVEDREEILAFVRGQQENPRNATQKKAVQFLKKHVR